ncbi:MAG: response regulator transcription factor [Steroidobacteraceae bacterium]
MPSAPTESIRVLVVDDHPVMREGVAAIIAAEPDLLMVGQAATGREAIDAFRELHPDVTLMDLQMPEMDGISAIAEIMRRWPQARVLVLTTFKGDVQTLRALKAGACGYLLKSMIRKDLLGAIRDAHRGRVNLMPEVAAELGHYALNENLSEREIEVLRHVATGSANKQIAFVLGLSEETIKTHMKSILNKLQANDRTHAVMIAMQRGIINAWSDS